jgi:hypothetical protein
MDCTRQNTKQENKRDTLVAENEGRNKVIPIKSQIRRWVDNIKMDRRETGWDGVDWIDMARDRDQWRALVNTVLNLRVP